MFRRLRADFILRLFQRQSGFVQGLVGALDRHDCPAAEAAPLQPFRVDAVGDSRITTDHHVRRQVLEQQAASADHHMRTNLAKLVHANKTAENGEIVHAHMPGQLHAVGKDDVAANMAVVRQMHICHDPVVVADLRDTGVLRGTDVEGTVFADDIVVTDFQPHWFASVFLVLRDAAQRVELENAVVLANASVPFDHHMRADRRARADLDMLADDGIGADCDIIRQSGIGVDERRWMYYRHYLSFIVHMISASAATWPSTSATARNFHSPRMLRVGVTLRINWSPGTTGRLKRAPSMPTK